MRINERELTMVQCENGRLFVDYNEWVKHCIGETDLSKQKFRRFLRQENSFLEEFNAMWPGEPHYIIDSYCRGNKQQGAVTLKRKMISLRFAFAILSFLMGVRLS